ncbi:nucleoside triphosphate pyrophosphohydrolase family protein [Sporosarcina contaminans]|uniref:Nucleoside triphosphate pyrophosphohydrolase family protein n=1 Tax=Sporosarcina contaminans TaxID=633403 RepID=A0ABW3TS54_9BACL
MTFWPEQKRAQMKELKQARFNILQYINYLDRFRCDVCSGRVQEGVYADKTKCDCEAARRIRELGQVLIGNKQKIIEKFRELRKMTVLETLTEENLTRETYLDMKALGLTDRQIKEQLGWHGVKFNQWKHKEGLIGQRLAPAPEPEETKKETYTDTVLNEETVNAAEVVPAAPPEPVEGVHHFKAGTAEPVSTIKAAILDDIGRRIDQQTEKGVNKYSHTLDDCPPNKYDWQTMIIEELVDALQYQQKEIRRLKDVKEMSLLEYQELSKRTMPGPATSPEEFKLNVSNYAMGLAGEAGEVVDLLKKHLHHGHEIDKAALIGEIGDVLHYASGLCSMLGIDFEEVGRSNIKKLEKRYPNGFCEADSINRSE